jgi:hypothetical protein
MLLAVRFRRLMLLVSAVALVALIAVVSAAAHVFIVHGDIAIGAYRVRADGSLAGVVQAFGEPARAVAPARLAVGSRGPDMG